MALSSGHAACPLEDEIMEQYKKDLPGPWNDIVRLQPGGWIMTKRYLHLEKAIYNFKFRPDDVLVMTYPKCGTTWTQEIVWNMRNNPSLDNPDAEDALFIRSPYIELDMLIDPAELQSEENQKNAESFLKGIGKYCPNPDLEQSIMIQIAEGHTKGRTLKTHLPFSFFPKSLIDTVKVVYVTRNIKDQVLSALHHYRLVNQHGFTGTQSTFVDYFVKDLLLYGSYGRHVQEVWANHEHPNFHMLFFEDLKGDTLGQLKKLDKFLGTKLTEEQFQNVIKQTSFKTLKEADVTKEMKGRYNQAEADKEGLFFRKGEAGSWKGKYSPEDEAKLDAYTKKFFSGLDIDFKYQ